MSRPCCDLLDVPVSPDFGMLGLLHELGLLMGPRYANGGCFCLFHFLFLFLVVKVGMTSSRFSVLELKLSLIFCFWTLWITQRRVSPLLIVITLKVPPLHVAGINIFPFVGSPGNKARQAQGEMVNFLLVKLKKEEATGQLHGLVRTGNTTACTPIPQWSGWLQRSWAMPLWSSKIYFKTSGMLKEVKGLPAVASMTITDWNVPSRTLDSWDSWAIPRTKNVS